MLGAAAHIRADVAELPADELALRLTEAAEMLAESLGDWIEENGRTLDAQTSMTIRQMQAFPGAPNLPPLALLIAIAALERARDSLG